MRLIQEPTVRGTMHYWGLPVFVALVGVISCSDQGATPTANNPNPSTSEEAYDHLRAAGESAADLLSGDTFDRLIVEVQYVQGFRPSDEGLQRVQMFLNDRLNKPGGITIQVGAPLQIQAQTTYSIEDVRALEQQHRTIYTEGTTLAAYLLFLDGEYDQSANVLGIAHLNTSMAIFIEKIWQYSGGPLEPSQSVVEGTVANHEFGHILGLVNSGSSMQTEHQDEPNGHHCDDQGCLMYYAVRTTDFIANLTGGMPAMDANCLADLHANGGR